MQISGGTPVEDGNGSKEFCVCRTYGGVLVIIPIQCRFWRNFEDGYSPGGSQVGERCRDTGLMLYHNERCRISFVDWCATRIL